MGSWPLGRDQGTSLWGGSWCHQSAGLAWLERMWPHLHSLPHSFRRKPSQNLVTEPGLSLRGIAAPTWAQYYNWHSLFLKPFAGGHKIEPHNPALGFRCLHLAACVMNARGAFLYLRGSRIRSSLTLISGWVGKCRVMHKMVVDRNFLVSHLLDLKIFSLPSSYWRSNRVYSFYRYLLNMYIKHLLYARHCVELKFAPIRSRDGGDRHNHTNA